ncbi:transposase, IS605 OrfB family [Sulfolobus islandicus M.14.25]|uniref:Transposase, IS605 OrfB family n=1 Tax=Saccharolobus islandicus (strain M.14.25 / Kamchatka \|nr:RNA-guided endonuclease TnpB family protein [Sulfolobus islandicus]ACP37349.1 transposase, IS605 OrfB family [Sulfolobus islandicus M.14.25]
MKRTNVVKLIVDKNTHEKLKELTIATAKCWNEVNWLRMQQYKKGERIDFAKTEKEVYEKYKQVLKVNAQQVARKNAEDWRSFFSLIEEKKEGKLPKWFKPRPPSYWKDESGKYKLIILVRNDRYEVDENKRIIYLKDFKLALKFNGKIKWHGKQGRLEVIYDEVRRSWYAHIPIEVENNVKAKGNLRASVDLGIVNLATIYVEDRTWYIFKGGSVLSQYEYYGKRIGEVQKVLARHGQRRSMKLKLLYDKRRRFLKHALNSMVRKIMEELGEKGVSEVIIGYPKGINKNHGNKLTVNFWNYSYVIKRFEEVGEELGIKIMKVEESYTSKTCSLCGETHEGGRVKRGLFKCPRMGKVMNADLNGAINILHIPESQGTMGRGLPMVRDRGNGLKFQPVVYRWTSEAGWVIPTSYEVMRMKAVNHKPMIRPEGTLALQAGRWSESSCLASNPFWNTRKIHLS